MHGPWLLLVDDDPDHVALALRALRKLGVAAEVVVAHSAAEVFDCLYGESAQRRTLPRVVLLDLNLPAMSGFEVLRRLRSEVSTQMVPVVIFSSSDEEGDLTESYRLGANSYIHKPVDFDHFTETLRATGSYWLSLNRAASGG